MGAHTYCTVCTYSRYSYSRYSTCTHKQITHSHHGPPKNCVFGTEASGAGLSWKDHASFSTVTPDTTTSLRRERERNTTTTMPSFHHTKVMRALTPNGYFCSPPRMQAQEVEEKWHTISREGKTKRKRQCASERASKSRICGWFTQIQRCLSFARAITE